LDAESLFLPRHSREGGNPETYPSPYLVIPAKTGIQKRTTRRNAPHDLQPFGQEKTNWIPAFAGMTVFFPPSRE
jgi:hypothetical protein